MTNIEPKFSQVWYVMHMMIHQVRILVSDNLPNVSSVFYQINMSVPILLHILKTFLFSTLDSACTVYSHVEYTDQHHVHYAAIDCNLDSFRYMDCNWWVQSSEIENV